MTPATTRTHWLRRGPQTETAPRNRGKSREDVKGKLEGLYGVDTARVPDLCASQTYDLVGAVVIVVRSVRERTRSTDPDTDIKFWPSGDSQTTLCDDRA